MLIFIYGDDTFQVQEKVRTMKKAFGTKFDPTGMNTAEFYGKLVPGEVLGAARALPFLGEKRMVVIRDLVAGTKKADMKIWVDGLSDVPDSSIVIFWETTEPKALEKKPLFKALQEVSGVHHYAFPQLQGPALSRWVASRVKARGGTVDSQALQALVGRVGGDLWQMDSEIGKLVAYAGEDQISAEMVDELVHASFEGKIFDLIDAIAQRRSSQALRLLQEERWSGASDHYLLTMIGRQVRILLGARALLDDNPAAMKQELANELGVHPYVAQKALAQARGFTLEGLMRVHDQLFDFDRKMKSGRITADLAVDLTAVSLMK